MQPEELSPHVQRLVDELHKQCKNIDFPQNKDRPVVSGLAPTPSKQTRGNPCESIQFGVRFRRHGAGTDLDANKKYAYLYRVLLQLTPHLTPPGEPLYNSFTINHVLKCEPHVDQANSGCSAIIAFGDFELVFVSLLLFPLPHCLLFFFFFFFFFSSFLSSFFCRGGKLCVETAEWKGKRNAESLHKAPCGLHTEYDIAYKLFRCVAIFFPVPFFTHSSSFPASF